MYGIVALTLLLAESRQKPVYPSLRMTNPAPQQFVYARRVEEPENSTLSGNIAVTSNSVSLDPHLVRSLSVPHGRGSGGLSAKAFHGYTRQRYGTSQ
jgi:hypothetical protein